MKRSKAIGLWSLFAFGVYIGDVTAGDPTHEVVKVPYKVTVHDPAETITKTETVTVVQPLHDSCVRAMDESKRLADLTGAMYANGNRQLDIFSNGRSALADGQNTTPVEDQQRDLMGHEVGTLANAEDALSRYEAAYKICKEEMKGD